RRWCARPSSFSARRPSARPPSATQPSARGWSVRSWSVRPSSRRPTVTERDSEAVRRRVLIIDAVRFACLGGAAASAPVALLGTPELAISIVLGTLLGAVNFVLLARGIGSAIDRTVYELERT